MNMQQLIVVRYVDNRVWDLNVASREALQMLRLIDCNIFSDGDLGFWEKHGLQYSYLYL